MQTKAIWTYVIGLTALYVLLVWILPIFGPGMQIFVSAVYGIVLIYLITSIKKK